MKIQGVITVSLSALLVVGLLAVPPAWANGGPFVVKYPGGDPAAKGVLARLDPNLKPAFETRLRVLQENLKVQFERNAFFAPESSDPPLVRVSAEYTIENPLEEEIFIDFGFPILRGVYMNPLSMMPRPDVEINLGAERIPMNLISNSAIYGIIRQRARETIESAILADARLQRRVSAVRRPGEGTLDRARQGLFVYLTQQLGWTGSDATLLVEFAGFDLGQPKAHPYDRPPFWSFTDEQLNELMSANLGPLAAIGEQKATQLFAQLASRFDPQAASTYEGIFTDWGGDVRERSVDLETGRVRPREITVSKADPADVPLTIRGNDPTIYARVDYLDPQANITEAEKASCQAILKNLPVIFTFAPMNLLHCTLKFPAASTRTLTVTYKQFAFQDTREPASYQIAYVVHPAQHWKHFGPIHLEAAVPEGLGLHASVPVEKGAVQSRKTSTRFPGHGGEEEDRFDVYKTVFDRSRDEIFLAIDERAWKEFCNEQIKEAKLESKK